ncbi:MAG: hypothetical protein HFF05_04680 [Oscillospiraceae bacterium]|nr:hypothetical protein [Oscillospiraceae bacterium]
MKQGTFINRIVMILFFAAILLYFIGAAWRELRDPYPTVQAYSYGVDDTVEVTGYLVREEKPLSGQGGIVRLLPNEGEKVAVGSTVALLYADELSLERSERLETLETEMAQLTAAIAAAGESSQRESGQRVIDTLITLRASIEEGDFTRMENQVTSFKSAVYQQAQRYGNADDLAAAVAATQAEIDTLRAQTAQSTGQVAVEESGIFSGQVDGYENILTPDMLTGLTVATLDALEGHVLPVSKNQLGKLITDSTWYFVFSMPEDTAKRLTEGRTVTVRFSRDWAGEIDMTVERIGTPENGRLAVTLSSNRFLSDTTLLRRQTVELVFSSRIGIRVPREAVRVETVTETETDPDTKEERQVERQVTCVYVQVGINAELKPVTILAQGEDYYVVESAIPKDAKDSQAKKALRSGDLVIVAGEDIWDGKVLG